MRSPFTDRVLHRLAIIAVLLIVAAGLAAVLPGCSSLPESPQQAINEARATLIAGVRLNRQYLAEDIITVEEHDQRLAEMERLNEDLKLAEKLLGLGEVDEARTKAAVVHRLALRLRTELEERVKR